MGLFLPDISGLVPLILMPPSISITVKRKCQYRARANEVTVTEPISQTWIDSLDLTITRNDWELPSTSKETTTLKVIRIWGEISFGDGLQIKQRHIL